MSEQALTQQVARERLAQLVFGDRQADATVAMRTDDAAQWVVAALGLAALLLGVPVDQHPQFVDRTLGVARVIRQAAGAGTPHENN